jgi:hypothetical protein
VTNSRRSSGYFVTNLAWGVGLGLAFAAVYSLYVAVLYLAEGSQPFDKLHTSLLKVIATYVIGGLTSGTVVGVMRPYLHIRFVAILVGITAAVFVFFGIIVASHGMPWHWDRAGWGSLALCSFLLGSFGGNWFWKHPLRFS